LGEGKTVRRGTSASRELQATGSLIKEAVSKTGLEKKRGARLKGVYPYSIKQTS